MVKDMVPPQMSALISHPMMHRTKKEPTTEVNGRLALTKEMMTPLMSAEDSRQSTRKDGTAKEHIDTAAEYPFWDREVSRTEMSTNDLQPRAANVHGTYIGDAEVQGTITYGCLRPPEDVHGHPRETTLT